MFPRGLAVEFELKQRHFKLSYGLDAFFRS